MSGTVSTGQSPAPVSRPARRRNVETELGALASITRARARTTAASPDGSKAPSAAASRRRRRSLSYRIALLRKHRCYQTLRNIAELGGSGAPSDFDSQTAQIDLSVARRFYGYLAAGDGERACELVIPEKRYGGRSQRAS